MRDFDGKFAAKSILINDRNVWDDPKLNSPNGFHIGKEHWGQDYWIDVILDDFF